MLKGELLNKINFDNIPLLCQVDDQLIFQAHLKLYENTKKYITYDPKLDEETRYWWIFDYTNKKSSSE